MVIVDGDLDDPEARTKFIVEKNKGTDERIHLRTGFQVKMVYFLPFQAACCHLTRRCWRNHFTRATESQS